MKVKVDKVLGKPREWDTIPQFNTDPASPKAEDAWVLRSATGGGDPLGLLLSLTNAGTIGYQFSYRTKEGTTIRTTLS